MKIVIARAEILRNARDFQNPNYLHYLMPLRKKTISRRVRHSLSALLALGFRNINRIQWLKNQLQTQVRKKQPHFANVQKAIQNMKADVFVCTHQRSHESMVWVEAARTLGIPTMAFIFSWDNLPKGTLLVQADYYLVWSAYMARELQDYYPWIKPSQIKIVGAPQFLHYRASGLAMTREEFACKFGLNPAARWICFSGDDQMTSPYDPLYLRDLAEAVAKQDSMAIQILFRPSPADCSDRYNAIVATYPNLIKIIPPAWYSSTKMSWNQLIPQAEDNSLLACLAAYCEAVFNVGSTMAIDFSIFGKPAAYFRYNAAPSDTWDIHKIYRFIHFQSMGELDPVYWLDHPDQGWDLEEILSDSQNKVAQLQAWQSIISVQPIDQTGNRMWEAIQRVGTQSLAGHP
ncbi:MAG: hypothetical protein KDC71_24300 [Acidobacteria bacterium]|nr:hypothetical protein [Acidobacteriota bacterium]